jgi:outer membrane protein OmpA-like peptidoglycan-associated protein
MRRPLWLALGLLVGAASPASAQAGGSIELGLFGLGTNYDKSFQLDNGFGGGGRLGLFLAHNWAVTADIAAASSSSKVTGRPDVAYHPLHARLERHWGSSDQFIVGLGYAHESLTPKGGNAISASGVSGAIGFQHDFGAVVGLRIDALADYYSTGANDAPGPPTTTNVNYSLQAGLNFRFAAHQGPRDSDHDGIPDKTDVCPGTPAGTAVDARGCPLPQDSDHDGVTDDVDACPGTPAGTRVDARGCPVPVDSDHDGVPDNADACPGTPAGQKVDARGCPIPIDSDGDGVTDDVDACPGTPAGQKVDARGCPLPIDSDGDGVTDDKDACPGTPIGQRVDLRGCPLPVDSDGDGVPDNLDRCPGTMAGQKVDANGCPQLFEPGKTNVTLQGVTFLSGRAVLTPNAKIILDGVASALAGNPDVRVEIQGYTDNTGPRARNVQLSQQRANAVLTYLASKGVPTPRMRARGYGPANPVASNASAAGRAQNRRVELKRLP